MKYIQCNISGHIIVEMTVPSRRKLEFTPEIPTLPIDETNSIAEGFVWRIDVPDLLSKKRQFMGCCMNEHTNLDIFVEM